MKSFIWIALLTLSFPAFAEDVTIQLAPKTTHYIINRAEAAQVTDGGMGGRTGFSGAIHCERQVSEDKETGKAVYDESCTISAQKTDAG